MTSRARRDEMIVTAMDAVEKSMTACDAAGVFEVAATVVDALLDRYKIKPRTATEGTECRR